MVKIQATILTVQFNTIETGTENFITVKSLEPGADPRFQGSPPPPIFKSSCKRKQNDGANFAKAN